MNKNGITLIALVVTIIVLLILAAVSITLILGPDGVVEKAREAKVTGRYNTIMDMLTTREAELAVVLKTGLTTGGAKSAKSFVEDLMSEGLITADEYYEEEDDYITVYLGKQSDGTYKYEIEVREGLALEYSPNMILSIKTTTVNEEVELPISNTTGLTINWNTKDDPNNFVAPNSGINPTNVYSQPDTYEVQIKGKVEENHYFGYDIDKTNENIVELKNWGENGFYYFGSFGENLKGKIPTPNENSFINILGFYETFSGCAGLTSLPANLFANCPNVEEFYRTFSDCTGLTSLPANLFANCSNLEWCCEIFYNCTGLTSLSATLFANCSNVESFYRTFSDCTGLTNLPENLFAGCSNARSFYYTFFNCGSLINIPENLFANCADADDFIATFAYCHNLTGVAPELWTITFPDGNWVDGEACFYECTNLSNYEDIPDLWKYWRSQS